MKIIEHLDKDNLHHAYLIEGNKDELLLGLLEWVENAGIKTQQNPDFYQMSFGKLKVKDAQYLKSFGGEKSFGVGKKVFLISADSILLDAQNTLLKMFEEPTADTHFFIIVPDINALLSTFVSRFYTIRGGEEDVEEMKKVKSFVTMSLQNRIDFLKELLSDGTEDKEDDEEEIEPVITNSKSAKALKFLNSLETFLHKHSFGKNIPPDVYVSYFEQIFKVRKFLRMPGSSTKILMESIALSIPEKI